MISSPGWGVPPNTPDAATARGLQRNGDGWGEGSPREGDDPPVAKSAASSDGSEEEDEEDSSDTDDDDDKRVKRPRLDQDLVTEWYEGPPMRPRDQRQCDEYFLRGRSLIRCISHLRDGHALSARHSRRLAHTLYAGKHNSLEHRTKNSDYVRRARAEYEALLLILQRRDKALMQRYVVAALVAVQQYHQLLLQVRLMEVVLHLLQEEDTGVEDLHTLVGLCRPLDYASLEPFLRRPPGEVLVGVVHSLLHLMQLRDLQATTLHHCHKTIYSLACAPVLGKLGYHGAPPRPDTALLYNTSAKVFHDYLGEEAHLLLLVALRASLLGQGLGPLSDLLLDRVARAARICAAPPCLLPLLERHLQATDARPGPRGCVAVLRLLRRCRRQLGQLQDLPALLQRLVALLVFDNDRPMTVARDLGRLLRLLREERPALLQATAKAGKAATRERLDGAVGGDVPLAAAQHFLVNLMRLVVGAARAVPLLPSTSSDSNGSESESDDPQEPEARAPPLEEVAATLLGLLGRQAEPRASWSSLACEVSQLLLPRHSSQKDVLAVVAALQLAVCLHDTKDDDRHAGDEHHGADNGGDVMTHESGQSWTRLTPTTRC